MIDLTPLDVRKKRGDFRRILRGYDPEEVDTFLEAVEARMEALVMENLALTEKADRLTSQVEALEGRERAVQEALVTAQKLREDVQDQSQKEAASVREQVKRETEALRGEAHREAAILKDEAIREAASVRENARKEADLLWKEVVGEVDARVHQAEGALEERQRALEELERSRRKFLKGFRSLLEREIDAVEVEESRRPLEETPLELNLRGWARDGEEEGREEGEEPDETTAEPAPPQSTLPEPDAYEPVFDLDVQRGEGPEEESTQGWGAMPGDEPPEGEFSDIVPVGVFEPGSDDGMPAAAVDEPENGPGERPDDLTEGPAPPVVPEHPDATPGITVNLLLDRDSGGGATADAEPPWLSTILEGVGNAGGEGEEGVADVEPEPLPGSGGGEEEGEDEPRID